VARDLLLEVGSEEIPASFILPALEDLKRVLTERMAAARLKHGEVRTFGTPRRLAVLVKDIADSGEDVTSEKLGPSAKAAFDKEGKPTVAATKFVLCQADWFKRYEAGLLEAYRANVWPLGADFEPHWCLVLSLDTRLAAIV